MFHFDHLMKVNCVQTTCMDKTNYKEQEESHRFKTKCTSL